MIKLHQGLALKSEGAYSICRSGETQIVALMGSIGSGKTTLIAGIFQAFLAAPVAGYSFRRSDTLVGFEEKCFNSRTASDADIASMPRTSRQVGIEYYHLEVQRDCDRSIHRLLIIDMSGEFYESAIHLRDDAAELSVLRNVDKLVHMLDGRKLASVATREKVYSDAKALIRRLSEVQSIRPDTALQMVISKIDQLAPDTTEVSLRAAKSKAISRFAQEAKRPSFELREIAASPAPETPFSMRFGLPELFESWLVEPEIGASVQSKIRVHSSRLLHQLGLAWMPERYVTGE